MSHSVVKVTEDQTSDSLILVIGEDGTVTPDKETVESYLKSKSGATELQVMHVNKIDGQNIDVTLDTLMYVHSEEVIDEPLEDMDEIARNLLNFRMDHDYTPLTSPKRQSPVQTSMSELDDELAQTLSILEGTETRSGYMKPTKLVKANAKTIKKPPPQINRQKARMINVTPAPPPKQTKPPLQQKSTPTPKPKQPAPPVKQEEPDELDEQDSDFDIEFEEDDSDSDFEIDEAVKVKPPRKTTPRRRSNKPESSIPKPPTRKAKVVGLEIPSKSLSQEPSANQEAKPSQAQPVEKKSPAPPPKKEKKIPKPPEDFALFSTPDIIRRVGGKEPATPTITPNPPQVESPKALKPAKIVQESRSKSSSSESPRTYKRISRDQSPEKMRTSTEDRDRKRERKFSTDKTKGHVSVQGYDESIGSNSSESLLESQLEPLPSAEDIRAIIQNENTKSFTTSLMSELEQSDQGQVNLESGGLDLDQSILDNINTDLISEDILYQVAQSLVDNPELQNVIDKSIVDGNLMLDSSLQQVMAQEPAIPQQTQAANNSMQFESNAMEVQNASPTKGTQIVRSDGRIVVIPPIERPTTRSRNKRHNNQESRQVSRSNVHYSLAKKNARPIKPLDEEHVSGNELDTSENDTEEDESEDDPNKLWCICNQPHNNRFMICCDTCEEWYHGKCVNVTKAMGQMMEEEGKEWICLYCKDPSLKRPSAAARRIRKASRTSTDSAGSQRKSSSASLTEPTTPACIVCGKPSRNSSIYCSDGCILKHAQGVEKVVVFERKSGRILSGANAPSAANLDAWLQEHPGFEVVRSTSKPSAVKKMSQSKLQIVKNSANDGVSLAVQRKGVNIGVLPHSPKQSHAQENLVKDKAAHAKDMQTKLHKKITGLKIISRQVSVNQPKTKLIQPVPMPPKTPAATSTPSKPKPAPPPPPPPTTPPTPKEKPMPQKTPKARQAEVSAQPQQENIRENVKKTLMEQLLNRIKMADDLKLNEEQVANISSDIETQLFKCFGDTGQKYRNRYRSLIFNIKDVKNQTLWRKICEKSINPYQLVRLSPDDLASQELALWREREAKHQLDMIKKSELELLSCNRQFVFKTHKGEQVFEDDRPKDQTVTEVITGLGADSTSNDKEEGKRDGSKEGERKSSKHKKDHGKDKERKSSREKGDSKEKRRDRQSSSKDRDKEKERDRRKRSRSREHSTKHLEKKRSRSRDRDRHRRATHKSSRHSKKDVHSTTDKLDNKSKEILKQLVDKQIVPPLEDRLWKHVPQEDLVPVPNIESDSDHEPSSTVTIPTPPRSSEADEVSPPMQAISEIPSEDSPEKGILRTASVDSNELFSPKDDSGGLSPVLRNQTEHVWKGTINMIDVAQISITAHEVSGDCNGLREELPTSLDIVGRISPETVWEYIGKMRCSNSKMISLLRLNATNMEEKMPYIALYSYLSSRNRLGVVKSPNKAVKDFYILPLASRKPIPQALLPISGPGFEESRPPLLLGIIVRDKRKRSYLDSIQPVASKRSRLEAAVIPAAAPATPPISTPTLRSYTPPPSRDPRLKSPYVPPSTSLPSPPAATASAETPIDDMDEPYSPEDSDPETIAVPPLPEPSRLSTNVLPAAKPRSFLETGLVSQTFKPFSNKFETIPGLDDASSLPANSQELQRKMAELDQRIAMQKAELQNMSQHIASSASAAEIGTSALANIALPSNLQQILDSIKTIRAATSEASEPQQTSKDAIQGAQTDLTIPLMLPKISSRSLVGAQKHEAPSPTIPLNLPKPKVKQISATNSPQQFSDADKSSSSVLSSLSEEDLIRKANEMLGETSANPNKKQTFAPSTSYVYTPPPVASPQMHTPQKRSKIDLNQPPIPGLEDEC